MPTTRGLIDAPADTLAHMAEQAARIGAATLTRYAEIVHAALIEMRGTTSPRLVLELLCARMQLPDAAADSAALLQRIERLERRQSVEPGRADAHAGRAPERRACAEPPTTAHAAPSRRSADAGHRRRRARRWPTAASRRLAPRRARRRRDRRAGGRARPVADGREPAAASGAAARPPGCSTRPRCAGSGPRCSRSVKRSSRRTRALLDGAQVSDVDGDLVTLSIAAAPLARMLGEESNAEVIRAALTQTVGGEWRLTVVVDGGGRRRDAASVGRRSPPDAGHPAAAAAAGRGAAPARPASGARARSGEQAAGSPVPRPIRAKTPTTRRR